MLHIDERLEKCKKVFEAFKNLRKEDTPITYENVAKSAGLDKKEIISIYSYLNLHFHTVDQQVEAGRFMPVLDDDAANYFINILNDYKEDWCREKLRLGVDYFIDGSLLQFKK